jgi:hypothetical protein
MQAKLIKALTEVISAERVEGASSVNTFFKNFMKAGYVNIPISVSIPGSDHVYAAKMVANIDNMSVYRGETRIMSNINSQMHVTLLGNKAIK